MQPAQRPTTYFVGSSTPLELLCGLACQHGGTSLGRLRTRCRWGPVDGVGKGCGLCARMKQALYPSLRKPGRGPALDPTPGVSTQGRSNKASVTSKYTMWYHACWAIRCCMCRGPYRATAHGLTGGDAARRGTTRRFGPVQRGGAGIRHGASYQRTVRRCRKTLVGMVNSRNGPTPSCSKPKTGSPRRRPLDIQWKILLSYDLRADPRLRL